MSQVREKIEESNANGRYWWRKSGEERCAQPQPKPGDVCTHCGEGTLAFDGLFILACDQCQHIADSGGFT
ncbi:hypothetical protein [Candidatus Leptofilum sp.]|uniref:hypothetical protein n=1 Tax=Candidatus Leptofilum sp. TaxID=3241576 RepID=UPI003B5BE159